MKKLQKPISGRSKDFIYELRTVNLKKSTAAAKPTDKIALSSLKSESIDLPDDFLSYPEVVNPYGENLIPKVTTFNPTPWGGGPRQTTGTTSFKLVDSGATFETWNVSPFDHYIGNITTGESALILKVDNETTLTLDKNIMTTGDFYYLYSLLGTAYDYLINENDILGTTGIPIYNPALAFRLPARKLRMEFDINTVGTSFTFALHPRASGSFLNFNDYDSDMVITDTITSVGSYIYTTETPLPLSVYDSFYLFVNPSGGPTNLTNLKIYAHP